jgi:hypothetical protein
MPVSSFGLTVIALFVLSRHIWRSRYEILQRANITAAVLGLFLGPVGLWFKRRWLAGIAWLAAATLLGVGPGGMGIPMLPILLVGMAIHGLLANSDAPRFEIP